MEFFVDATRCIGLRDGETGFLVPPNDPAATAAAIDRVLSDPAGRRRAAGGRRGRPGRGRYREHYQIGAEAIGSDDPARLVEWLVSDAGRWVVGQVLSTEGGFRRWD